MNRGFGLAAILSVCAVGAYAQAQNNCRDISTGGFLQPNEVIMQTSSGYMACRVINATPAKEEVRTESSAIPSAAIAPAKAPLVVQPTNSTVNSNDWRTPIVQAAAGYQYNSVNGSTNVYGFGFSTNRVNTNGAFAQVLVNVNRYVSPVGNIDFSYKNEYGSNYLLTYLGGVQAYPLSHGMWSPFARAMFGAGTLHISGYSSETGFAWQVGGGLDWKPRHEGRMILRLATFDYARVSKDGVNLNSLKVGTGIVF